MKVEVCSPPLYTAEMWAGLQGQTSFTYSSAEGGWLWDSGKSVLSGKASNNSISRIAVLPLLVSSRLETTITIESQVHLWVCSNGSELTSSGTVGRFSRPRPAQVGLDGLRWPPLCLLVVSWDQIDWACGLVVCAPVYEVVAGEFPRERVAMVQWKLAVSNSVLR